MWDWITTLVPGLVGMRFEYIVVLIVNIGGLIFYAMDFKLGSLLSFIINGLLFVWFYEQELTLYYVPLTLMFMSLILLSFTLYAVNKQGSSPGGFV